MSCLLFCVHAYLLVTSCNGLDATLWLLVVIYIARSSAKRDPSTPFHSSPNIPLIATRKRVTLSTLPCGISKSACLFCGKDPCTLTLIHLSPISSLMNSIILPCIPMFSSCLSVFSLCCHCHMLSLYQRRLLLFCFLKSNCLSSIFFSFSRYQTSLFFVILLNILQSMFVRATGL